MKLLNEKIILLIGVGSGCPKIFLGKKNKCNKSKLKR